MSYDMNNTKKSWLGQPTTNLLTNPNSAINVNSTGVPAEISVPGYSSYSSGYAVAFWSPVSTAATGVTFTYSMYMRSPGGVSTYLMYVYTGTGPDGGWNYAGSGSLTDTWTRYTYTSGSWTGTVTNVCVYRFNQTGTIEIAAPQFEVNSFATPFVIGSRSNTQAIMDQTGNNTFTASSLTYASDNTFSFNNTYVSLPSLNLQQNFTLECWVNLTSAGTTVGFFGQGPTAASQGLHIGWFVGRGLLFGMYGNDLECPSYNMTYNTWHHFVYTYDSGTYFRQTWADGVLVASGTPVASPYAGSGQFNIGSIFSSPVYTSFTGKFAVARAYSKVLSATEIQQNFNALRGRYGV